MSNATPEQTPFPITRELLDRTLEVPQLNTSPLPEYSYERLDYGMTIGIERTPGGRLWACWVGGGDNDKAFFVLACSNDDGETWSDPKLVIDPHDSSLPYERRTIVGTLWTDPQGRLWLFFDQALAHYDGRAGDWYTRCDNPDDVNPVWTTPQRIWHGMTLNKPVILSTGEWLLPISLWSRDKIKSPFTDCYPELDELRMANVFSSTDQGQTWSRKSGVVFPKSDFDEHMIVERKNGTLWMMARTWDSIWESFSNDYGLTWSAPRPSSIQHINSRFHIRRLLSGRLLLVKHGDQVGIRTEQRSHLTAFISNDDGDTWSDGLLLDERFQVSYPDSTQAPDGTIYVSYDRNRSIDGEILLARITEEDLWAGKCISPQSALRKLISRPLGRKNDR
ncbi:sialidase family protein [Paenibacillus thalictri]|uniref:Exo-alpha-sialidase n=1 Tax=Paenibacillus thalictri TaxID=2527873 RepID=A0A4Q9DE88_9BACL|nr:sialidase family protein [Paenibacillus thalictri]TBL69105.1 exo-alpha-sialidase [Paenibacillus thalictri]